jgi:hypothetical protein
MTLEYTIPEWAKRNDIDGDIQLKMIFRDSNYVFEDVKNNVSLEYTPDRPYLRISKGHITYEIGYMNLGHEHDSKPFFSLHNPTLNTFIMILVEQRETTSLPTRIIYQDISNPTNPILSFGTSKFIYDLNNNQAKKISDISIFNPNKTTSIIKKSSISDPNKFSLKIVNQNNLSKMPPINPWIELPLVFESSNPVFDIFNQLQEGENDSDLNKQLNKIVTSLEQFFPIELR